MSPIPSGNRPDDLLGHARPVMVGIDHADHAAPTGKCLRVSFCRIRRTARFLLPACGEKAGMRGRFASLSLWSAPHRRASRVDLSPQAGRGEKAPYPP